MRVGFGLAGSVEPRRLIQAACSYMASDHPTLREARALEVVIAWMSLGGAFHLALETKKPASASERAFGFCMDVLIPLKRLSVFLCRGCLSDYGAAVIVADFCAQLYR